MFSIGMPCFMTYSVYSLSFSSIFPQQSVYIMMVTLFFLLSIGWTLVSMIWFVICNYYVTKGEMLQLLYILCDRLQRVFFCCFLSTETAKVTSTEKIKCFSCQKLFTTCLRKRVAAENIDVPSFETNIKPITTVEYVNTTEMTEKQKSKCKFCGKCESYQTDCETNETKNKKKKDFETKCKILNYFVFFCVALLMIISNIVLWLIMAN